MKLLERIFRKFTTPPVHQRIKLHGGDVCRCGVRWPLDGKRCRDGHLTQADVDARGIRRMHEEFADELVTEWHRDGSGDLHTYLRMTWDEYRVYAGSHGRLPDGWAARFQDSSWAPGHAA